MNPRIKLLQEIPGPYTSGVSGKGALISETERVLERIAAGDSVNAVRLEVVDANLLGKPTLETRKRVWETISQRYLSGRVQEDIGRLAMVVAAARSAQSRQLVLLYTFAQNDGLLYDFITDLLYQLYHSGRSGIGPAEVIAWLDEQSRNGHKEIATWSSQTHQKVVSNLLSIGRDFGLLEGAQRKVFRKLYVPLTAFVYVLYDQHERGLNGRQLVETPAFKLFLLDREDVLLLLGEASRMGYINFRHTSSVYDLTFRFPTLSEAMRYAIGREVS